MLLSRSYEIISDAFTFTFSLSISFFVNKQKLANAVFDIQPEQKNGIIHNIHKQFYELNVCHLNCFLSNRLEIVLYQQLGKLLQSIHVKKNKRKTANKYQQELEAKNLTKSQKSLQSYNGMVKAVFLFFFFIFIFIYFILLFYGVCRSFFIV